MHPQNRGGTMIQVYNMHLKGKGIIECGFDASLLAASTCFEVSPEERNKTYQIQANQKIHEAHHDFFAKCSRHERFLSVGSSHVSQFLPALQQGCKSPEDSLVDPRTGRMNMLSFRGNEMLAACSDGWVWYVIPWYVEVPQLVYSDYFA